VAIASVEISGVDFAGTINGPIYGKCTRQESLTISGTTATMSTAISDSDNPAYYGTIVARLCADANCYYAIGSSPDPTRTTSNSSSSARRFLPAGEISLTMSLGQKLAVVSA
jgi:hypothetical protein